MNYIMGIILMLIILGGSIATLFILSNNKKIAKGLTEEVEPQDLVTDALDEVSTAKSSDVVTILDVCFKGYSRQFTYAVNQKNIKKNQFVLVLTQDGIRCAKVVTQPREMKVKDLPFPSFLLQSIICVADETDIEYYS